MIKVRLSSFVIKLENKEVVVISKSKKEKRKKKNELAIGNSDRLQSES